MKFDVPTINIPEQPQPKPVKKRESSKGQTLDKTLESNVRLLVGSGFTLFARSLNNPMWDVGEDETKSISEPLTRILQRLNMGENMSKYSDYLALATSLSIVIAPRVILSQTMKPKKEVNKLDQKREDKKVSQSDNIQSDAVSTSNGSGSIKNSLAHFG